MASETWCSVCQHYHGSGPAGVRPKDAVASAWGWEFEFGPEGEIISINMKLPASTKVTINGRVYREGAWPR